MTRRAVARRLRRGFVVRPALSITSILVVYFTVPLHGEFRPLTVVVLACGLAALGAVVTWQARSIARDDRPRLRALEALATSVPLFLVMFAMAYLLMGNGGPDAFSEPLSRVDALYFTVTVFATVGFGDIAPRSQPARLLTMVQMLADLAIIGLVARVFLAAVQRGLQRPGRETPARETQENGPRPDGPGSGRAREARHGE
ncbi:potassium channel family protein [Actinomadura sp. NTSP31]|uniref:potassium channel family protein n=1 Tax=Actinomadura sp. NTSP31 TaxID=1735447 RepID=UPI0035BF5989